MVRLAVAAAIAIASGLVLRSGAAADVEVHDPDFLGTGPDIGCWASRAVEPAVEAPEPALEAPSIPETAPAVDPRIPRGRAIAALGARRCRGLLRGAGVGFEVLDAHSARGVRSPVRLTGTIGGVRVAQRSQAARNAIVDCRLAVALLAWAPALRRAGVVEVRHYSTYRPGARVGSSRRVSGHARGLAIDLSEVVFEDGEVLDVLHGWEARARGVDPCSGEREESARSATLRGAVCAAVARDLFQVVLTPHHDRAHRNHVHLEVRPDVGWSFVR